MAGTKIFSPLTIGALIVVFLCSYGEASNAQSARQKGNFFARRLTMSAGVQYSFKQENVSSATGLNISPRVFLTTTYSDFSVSASLDFMGNYRLDNTTEDIAEEIFFQLPTMLHLNIGHGASKDFHSAIGGFLGAGWNVQYDGQNSVNGFAMDAGFRFWLFGNSFTLRFINLTGNEKIFSSGKIILLHVNLGKYLADVKANNKVSNFMKPYSK
jgi:hypothetical protein